MSRTRPSFLDSPYFVLEPDNWHLTDDAPEEVRKEFEEYMNNSDLVVASSNDSD